MHNETCEILKRQFCNRVNGITQIILKKSPIGGRVIREIKFDLIKSNKHKIETKSG